MAANDQKSAFILQCTADSFFRDSTCSHPPSCHQSQTRHREAPMFHGHACTETQAGGGSSWVSNTEIALKTLSSDKATAVFSQISKRHALWQDRHHMCIAYFNFHHNLSAGTCRLQTVARIKMFQFTRSTAPSEPTV